MRNVYLDYNATTPVAPSVVEAMGPFWTEHFGNASSAYRLGTISRAAIEEARGNVASLVGGQPQEIVFTSGGTESNNLALLGAIRGWETRQGHGVGHVVISAIEHPAVSGPATELRRLGYEVSVCPCDRNGVLDLSALEDLLRPQTVLVSVMLANNETGAIQPVREISKLCRPRGILLHTDAAQAIGKMRVDVTELGVDLLTMAGHKFYAPKGIGALFVRDGVLLGRVLFGANQELGLSPGTECVPLVVGLGRAAQLAVRIDREHMERQARLRDQLEQRIAEGIDADVRIHASGTERLSNTSSLAFPGLTGRDLLAEVPDLSASTGAACHTGQAGVSATLKAMRVPPRVAAGTIRLSTGWPTSEDEIALAADWLIAAWERLITRV
ncbi:MAG TPA: cysteine desulfurase family protein [Pirellulaceae bacterium]